MELEEKRSRWRSKSNRRRKSTDFWCDEIADLEDCPRGRQMRYRRNVYRSEGGERKGGSKEIKGKGEKGEPKLEKGSKSKIVAKPQKRRTQQRIKHSPLQIGRKGQVWTWTAPAVFYGVTCLLQCLLVLCGEGKKDRAKEGDGGRREQVTERGVNSNWQEQKSLC